MIDEKILIEKIKEHAKKVGGSISEGGVKSGYLLAHEHIVGIIHFMQTTSKPVATVIPPLKAVVLCKNCVHYNKGLFQAVCCRNRMHVKENDFCSFGKWKD